VTLRGLEIGPRGVASWGKGTGPIEAISLKALTQGRTDRFSRIFLCNRKFGPVTFL